MRPSPRPAPTLPACHPPPPPPPPRARPPPPRSAPPPRLPPPSGPGHPPPQPLLPPPLTPGCPRAAAPPTPPPRQPPAPRRKYVAPRAPRPLPARRLRRAGSSTSAVRLTPRRRAVAPPRSSRTRVRGRPPRPAPEDPGSRPAPGRPESKSPLFEGHATALPDKSCPNPPQTRLRAAVHTLAPVLREREGGKGEEAPQAFSFSSFYF